MSHGPSATAELLFEFILFQSLAICN